MYLYGICSRAYKGILDLVAVDEAIVPRRRRVFVEGRQQLLTERRVERPRDAASETLV